MRLGYEPETNAKGENLISPDVRVVDRLSAQRGPGESPQRRDPAARRDQDEWELAPGPRTSRLSAFRPRPRRNAPAFRELSESHRENPRQFG